MGQIRALYFAGVKQVEIRHFPLRALNPDEVLVQSICSSISAGTEMLAYCGEIPQIDDSHDPSSSNLNYPFPYGYACVGKIVDIGKTVPADWLDRSVFAFQPHASHFISTTASLIPIPNSITPASACFLPNMETAVNLVQDGAPVLGERVLVFGQGIVGLLTASLLAEFPLECMVTVDRFEKRRRALDLQGLKIPKHQSLDPQADEFHERGKALLGDGADLTFELSGSPSALNDAIRLTRYSGRVVIGSWYGRRRGEIDLGGTFHRSRIKIISSQVSTINPELSGRWDKERRFDLTWNALERIRPEKWITHRLPIEAAGRAYELIDRNPQETLQVVITYS